MKAFQLFLLLFLLITLCFGKTPKEILKCAINKLDTDLVEDFVSTFKFSPDIAYALLAVHKGEFINAINACL